MGTSPKTFVVSNAPIAEVTPLAPIHTGPARRVRPLPDPAICRAEAAGFEDYVDCRVEQPIGCPHAHPFGFGHFCQHPKRNEIVLRTVALKRLGGGR